MLHASCFTPHHHLADILYYTGVRATLVPSLCNYTGARYSWRAYDPGRLRSIPVLGFRPLRGLSTSKLDDFLAPLLRLTSGALHGLSFKGYRALLGDYTYEQLARYPAILYVPYQVSVMSFYEQYSMGIPILAPTARLLAEWHMQYRMVSELTWSLVFGSASRKGVIPRHPSVLEADEPFDPNDEDNEAAVRHWLGFADFYTFPHIILFDSWEDLASILRESVARGEPLRAFAMAQRSRPNLYLAQSRSTLPLSVNACYGTARFFRASLAAHGWPCLSAPAQRAPPYGRAFLVPTKSACESFARVSHVLV
jgi:hypothetical protein